MNQNYFEPDPSYNSKYSGFDRPSQYPIDQSPPQEISIQDMEAAKLSIYTAEPSRCFNSFCYDDEDSTVPLNEIISQNPPSIAITPVLPIEDLEEFLIMKNEDLNSIPKKESDEVIKSSVDDLVPIPSESEETSGSDSECDLPSCDDFSPIDIPEGKSVTFSNPFFDSNNGFTSSDDEVLEDIESKASYDSNLDEPASLVMPLFDSNEDGCFDPKGDVDKINAFDIPLDFEDGYYDSKGDVLYLESLLSHDTTPNLPPEVFLDRDSRSLSDINELKIMVKVFDPGILEKKIFSNILDSPFLLSSGSEDTIFDPSIFAFHFSSLELVASHRSETFMCFNVYLNILNESPMEICSSTRFNPNITMIWGESS
nr:hypothetical protein [Tanacetum cinerariifolium]